MRSNKMWNARGLTVRHGLVVCAAVYMLAQLMTCDRVYKVWTMVYRLFCHIRMHLGPEEVESTADPRMWLLASAGQNYVQTYNRDFSRKRLF
jgi:hypothetical protein